MFMLLVYAFVKPKFKYTYLFYAIFTYQLIRLFIHMHVSSS